MLGALIGAGASLLGGILGNNSQNKQIDKQIAAQKEFAQEGIRWKVADATAAGIHPLYALGAQTNAFSPIGIGGNPLGEGIAAAGQEIGRAVQARQTSAERTYNAAVMALTLERGQLENQLLASQIARVNSPASLPPPTPMPGVDRWLVDGQAQSAPNSSPDRFLGPGLPGSTSTPLVEDLTQQRTISDPELKHQEPGAITDVGFARTASGGYAPVPSYDVKQRIEDQIIPELAWAMRNMVAPNLYHGWFNPPFKAPAGKQWTYSWADQAYHLIDSPR